MTEPHGGGGGATSTSARSPATLLYLAISAGTVVTLVVLVLLGSAGIVDPIPGLPLTVVRVVGLVLLVLGFTATGMLSGSIPPRQSGENEAAWWQANSGKAVATWAAAEGLAIVGGVLFLLTADLVLLAGLGGGGLVILVLNRPGRMMEG